MFTQYTCNLLGKKGTYILRPQKWSLYQNIVLPNFLIPHLKGKKKCQISSSNTNEMRVINPLPQPDRVNTTKQLLIERFN